MGRNVRIVQPAKSSKESVVAKNQKPVWKIAGLLIPCIALLLALWFAQTREEPKPIAPSSSQHSDRAHDRFKQPKHPRDVAADDLASGHVGEALRKLSEIQQARPSDIYPLRILHRGLIASANKNASGHYEMMRSAAAANFDAVLKVLFLATAKVRFEEVKSLRQAYQQLLLPELSARLGELVILKQPDLKDVDKAEILLESRRMLEAEELFARLKQSDPDSTYLSAQHERVQNERQADSERLKLLQLLNSSGDTFHWALHHPSTFSIVERRDASEIAYEEFLNNFIKARKPLILTGLDLYKDWDWDFIVHACGEVPVDLRAPVRSNRSVSWGGLRTTSTQVRLAEWIAETRKDLPRSDSEGFVFDFGLATPNYGCQKLLDQLHVPRFLANDIFKRLPASQRKLDPFKNSPGLFVQPSHSESALHVDALDSHFFQALLEGRKKWTFFALEPERQQLLLAKKLIFQIKENGPYRARETRWFELIGQDGEVGTNMLLQAAESHRVEVVLEKGEVLFVPGGVPHQVTQLAPSLAISLNYVDNANFDVAFERLLWSANFTENEEKKRALLELRDNLPEHDMNPKDVLLNDLLGS